MFALLQRSSNIVVHKRKVKHWTPTPRGRKRKRVVSFEGNFDSPQVRTKRRRTIACGEVARMNQNTEMAFQAMRSSKKKTTPTPYVNKTSSQYYNEAIEHDLKQIRPPLPPSPKHHRMSASKNIKLPNLFSPRPNRRGSIIWEAAIRKTTVSNVKCKRTMVGKNRTPTSACATLKKLNVPKRRNSIGICSERNDFNKKTAERRVSGIVRSLSRFSISSTASRLSRKRRATICMHELHSLRCRLFES